MSIARSLPSLVLLAALVPAAQAQDAARGKALYETHCLACHYERIHKRDPSRSLVRNLAQLRAEVARRAELAGKRFSVEDGDDIAEYLNQSHYRFGLGPTGARELIYGGELLSAKEREQFRRELAVAPDAAAEGQVRERHRERVRQRAKQRGLQLTEPAGTLPR